MRKRQAGLYFNPELGYIITSYALKKGSVLRYIIGPTITLAYETTSGYLSEKIVEALDISKNAQELEPSDAKDFEFWQSAGIKRFNSFSKEFRHVQIYEIEGKLKIVEWKRDKSGAYVGSKQDDEPTYLPLGATPEQIGSAVIAILSEDAAVADDTHREFLTLNGNKITYTRPSDAFIDIDDGHTDAYQIFTHEENCETSIAFFIDNQYREVTETKIREKWEKWHGKLIEFQYQEVADLSLKVKVTGKTENSKLVSYLYQDGDMLMEVATKIEQPGLSRKMQEEIGEDFRKVVNSIKITSA